MDRLTRIIAKYMCLGWTTKRLYDSTAGITRYIQPFFDFLVSQKKRRIKRRLEDIALSMTATIQAVS
jgi:hypothetical protein